MKLFGTEVKGRTGVYTISCNSYTYVGSAAKCFYLRFHQHLSDLRKNKHANKILQNVFNKYGQEFFKFEILEEYPATLCVGMEQYWMNLMEPNMNILKNAYSRLGYKTSEETKNKQRNRKCSKETIDKIKLARSKQIISKSIIEAMHKAHRCSVIDNIGNSFNSINEAAAFYNLPKSTAHHIVSGKIKKYKTGLKLSYKENI